MPSQSPGSSCQANLPPSFIADHHMVWTIPLVSWGQMSWLCLLPTSCAPPARLLAGQYEEQTRPGLCVSIAQQYLKHPCIINTVHSTNLKHSSILATMKKINSTPAKTSIFSTPYSIPFMSCSGPTISNISSLTTLLLPILQYKTQISLS